MRWRKRHRFGTSERKEEFNSMQRIALVFAALFVGSFTIAAEAGQKLSGAAPAYVNKYTSGGGYAGGILSSTRRATSAITIVTCSTSTSVFNNVVSESASCSATDPSGVSLSCYTSNPALAARAASIFGDSYVQFTVDASGTCTNIWISSSSGWSPKLD